MQLYGHVIRTVQRYDDNTVRIARTSDKALGVRVSVARIAPSLLNLGRAATYFPVSENFGIQRRCANYRQRRQRNGRQRPVKCWQRISANQGVVTCSPDCNPPNKGTLKKHAVANQAIHAQPIRERGRPHQRNRRAISSLPYFDSNGSAASWEIGDLIHHKTKPIQKKNFTTSPYSGLEPVTVRTVHQYANNCGKEIELGVPAGISAALRVAMEDSYYTAVTGPSNQSWHGDRLHQTTNAVVAVVLDSITAPLAEHVPTNLYGIPLNMRKVVVEVRGKHEILQTSVETCLYLLVRKTCSIHTDVVKVSERGVIEKQAPLANICKCSVSKGTRTLLHASSLFTKRVGIIECSLEAEVFDADGSDALRRGSETERISAEKTRVPRRKSTDNRERLQRLRILKSRRRVHQGSNSLGDRDEPVSGAGCQHCTDSTDDFYPPLSFSGVERSGDLRDGDEIMTESEEEGNVRMLDKTAKSISGRVITLAANNQSQCPCIGLLFCQYDCYKLRRKALKLEHCSCGVQTIAFIKLAPLTLSSQNPFTLSEVERFGRLFNIEVSMEQRWNARVRKTGVSRGNPRLAALSVTIPTCKNPAATPAENRAWFAYGEGEIVPDDTAARGFSRSSAISHAISFRHCSMLISITLIGSQDLTVKSRPNLFIHSLKQIIYRCMLLQGEKYMSDKVLLTVVTNAQHASLQMHAIYTVRPGYNWHIDRATSAASGVTPDQQVLDGRSIGAEARSRILGQCGGAPTCWRIKPAVTTWKFRHGTFAGMGVPRQCGREKERAINLPSGNGAEHISNRGVSPVIDYGVWLLRCPRPRAVAVHIATEIKRGLTIFDFLQKSPPNAPNVLVGNTGQPVDFPLPKTTYVSKLLVPTLSSAVSYSHLQLLNWETQMVLCCVVVALKGAFLLATPRLRTRDAPSGNQVKHFSLLFAAVNGRVCCRMGHRHFSNERRVGTHWGFSPRKTCSCILMFVFGDIIIATYQSCKSQIITVLVLPCCWSFRSDIEAATHKNESFSSNKIKRPRECGGDRLVTSALKEDHEGTRSHLHTNCQKKKKKIDFHYQAKEKGKSNEMIVFHHMSHRTNSVGRIAVQRWDTGSGYFAACMRTMPHVPCTGPTGHFKNPKIGPGNYNPCPLAGVKLFGRIYCTDLCIREKAPAENLCRASCGMILTLKTPRVTRAGIEPGSAWWEASSLTAQPPQPFTWSIDRTKVCPRILGRNTTGFASHPLALRWKKKLLKADLLQEGKNELWYDEEGGSLDCTAGSLTAISGAFWNCYVTSCERVRHYGITSESVQYVHYSPFQARKTRKVVEDGVAICTATTHSSPLRDNNAVKNLCRCALQISLQLEANKAVEDINFKRALILRFLSAGPFRRDSADTTFQHHVICNTVAQRQTVQTKYNTKKYDACGSVALKSGDMLPVENDTCNKFQPVKVALSAPSYISGVNFSIMPSGYVDTTLLRTCTEVTRDLLAANLVPSRLSLWLDCLLHPSHKYGTIKALMPPYIVAESNCLITKSDTDDDLVVQTKTRTDQLEISMAEEVDGTVASLDDRTALVAVEADSDAGVTDEEHKLRSTALVEVDTACDVAITAQEVDGAGKTGDISLEEEIDGEKPLPGNIHFTSL
ncbi:hypothetical protein PR048_000456 [Dryococelus australis]|uniref:Uncharacterized protein n=1 Tax=Dryococelus australis TaxID=614101 RepID=A0ABQ9IFK0_9NEOP|nr:hypothetical protein PR048_000456 [Dryococelus australis]